MGWESNYMRRVRLRDMQDHELRRVVKTCRINNYPCSIEDRTLAYGILLERRRKHGKW